MSHSQLYSVQLLELFERPTCMMQHTGGAGLNACAGQLLLNHNCQFGNLQFVMLQQSDQVVCEGEFDQDLEEVSMYFVDLLYKLYVVVTLGVLFSRCGYTSESWNCEYVRIYIIVGLCGCYRNLYEISPVLQAP